MCEHGLPSWLRPAATTTVRFSQTSRATGPILDDPEPSLGGGHHLLAITAGFVYMAAILETRSRRAVGYAIGRFPILRSAICAQPGSKTTKPRDGQNHRLIPSVSRGALQ
jgi:hypothetical protein